jgi:DNA-binding transcriptional LysR family regulator
MELDNLRAFISVAEQRSFSRAAERLHITQPAVSKRISALEAELDTLLFDRIGHKIILTEAGKALIPRARRILLEVEDSKRAVANLTEEIAGPLVIGTSHHIGLHRLPPVLRRFILEHPNVHLNIQFMDSEEACNAVIHGDLELGIVTLPLSPSNDLQLTPVWHDPLVIVAHCDHPLLAKKTVAANELSNYSAILPATGTFTREILEQALRPMQIKLNVGMSTNYLETIKMLVSVGLGWSVLPQSMLGDDIGMVNIPDLHMERTLGVVSHKERTLSNAARALLDTLHKSKKGLNG